MTWSSNEWWTLDPPGLASGWEPQLTASVVVPSYGGEARLEAVLAALAKQTYPGDLTSVVVSDDGSEPPLDPAIPGGLATTVIRQARDGFGLSRARAAGAAHEKSDVVAFVDADMLPEVTWLEAHMRWHHVAADAVVIGFRRHVDRTDMTVAEVGAATTIGAIFDGEPYDEPDWIEGHWERTDQGRTEADGMWAVASGGNVSVGRAVYNRTGGFSSNYWRQWGGEDNEFAYRLWTHGAIFIPERDALAWHLGRGTAQSEQSGVLRDQSRLRLASRVPDERLRRSAGIHYEVPRLALDLIVENESGSEVLEAVSSILQAAGGDVGINVVIDSGHPAREMLGRMLQFESRIELGSSLNYVHPRWRDCPVRGRSPVHEWSGAAIKRIVAEIGEGKAGRISVLLDEERRAHFWMTRLQSLAPSTPVEELAHQQGARIATVGEWG